MATKGLLSLKTVGIASATLVGTGLGVTAYQYYSSVPERINGHPKMVKISELPLYGNPEAAVRVLPEPSSPLRESIRAVRVVVWDWLEVFEGTRSSLNDKLEIGKAHTQSTIDMLQSNPSTLPRIGFIAGAGATGMLIGYRGGILKKTLYGSVLALTAASLCYPEETVNLFVNKFEDLKVSVMGPSEKSDTSSSTKTDSLDAAEKTDS